MGLLSSVKRFLASAWRRCLGRRAIEPPRSPATRPGPKVRQEVTPAKPSPKDVEKPSAWAFDEQLLNVIGLPKERPTDLVVGVDFGTSCTKIVIQSPYKLGGRAVAVPFRGAR